MQTPPPKKKIYSSMMQNALHFQHKIQNHLPLHQIHIPFHRLQEHLELYRWRQEHKNHLIAYEWTKIQPLNEKQVTITLKAMQKTTSLKQIKKIKGSKVIKNISKIFSAFQKLFQKFGPFEISSQMINFDSFYEPYVWMNNDPTKNEYKRDLVSEFEFGNNILMTLIKNNQKFQDHGFTEHCYQVKGEKYTLSDLTKHFHHHKEGQSVTGTQTKGNDLSTASRQAPLSFSKLSKIKKKNHSSHVDLKSIHRISNLMFKSYLQDVENVKKNPQADNRTLNDKKKVSHTQSTVQSYFQNNSLTVINTPKDLDSSFCFGEMNIVKQSGFSQRNNQLFVSVMDSEEQQQETIKEIIQLPQLDQYKRCLVKSIITQSKNQ